MANNKEEGVIELEEANILTPNRFDLLIKLGETLLKLSDKHQQAL